MEYRGIGEQHYRRSACTGVDNDVLLDITENLQSSQESRPMPASPRPALPRQVEKSKPSIYQKAQSYTKRRKLTSGAVDDLAQYSSQLEKAIHRKMAEMIGLENDSNLSNEDIAKLFLEKIDNGEVTPAQLSTLQAYTTALQEAYIKRVIKVYNLKPEDLGLTPEYFCEVYEFCEFLTAETTGKPIDSTTETTTTLTTRTTTASTTETTTASTTGITKALTTKSTTTLTTGTTTASTTETTTASTTETTTASTTRITTSTLPSTSSRTTLKGQLISKGLFHVTVSTKNQRNSLRISALAFKRSSNQKTL